MKPTYSDAGKLAWYPDIACPVCGGDVNSWDIFNCQIAKNSMSIRNRKSRQRLDTHGTIVVGSCETSHHYNVQGVK